MIDPRCSPYELTEKPDHESASRHTLGSFQASTQIVKAPRPRVGRRSVLIFHVCKQPCY